MVKRGHWVALTRYRDLDGVTRKVTATGPSKQGATAALQEKIRQRRVSGGRVQKDTTVEALGALWLDQKKANQASLDAYSRTLLTIVAPRIGQMTLGEVSTGSVGMFLGGIESVAERKRARTVLNQMFALAVQWDALEVNPVRDAQSVRSEKKDTAALSVEDLHALREHVAAWVVEHPRQAWVQSAVEVFVGTGIRPGELLALRWCDLEVVEDVVPFEDDGAQPVVWMVLHVRGTVKRDTLNGLHRQSHPKSKAGQRSITLPLFAVDALKAQSERVPLAGGERLVFPARGGGPMEPANFRRVWREVRGDAWKHVEPRSFRTAVATLVAREAGSQAAADQLGHGSTAITEKHYIARSTSPVNNTTFMGQLMGG